MAMIFLFTSRFRPSLIRWALEGKSLGAWRCPFTST